MNDREKGDSIFNSLLNVGVREAFEREMGVLPATEALNASHAPSPELDKTIRKLVRENRRKTKLQRFTKTLGRAAVWFFVLLGLSSAALLSVEATRNAIFNAVIEWQEKYTEIHFDETPARGSIYRPAHLPEGFSETSLDTFGTVTMLTYENGSGAVIVFDQTAADTGGISVDNEGTEYSEIEVAGGKGYLFEAATQEDSNVLIWQAGDTMFQLTSSVDAGELIRMAESLKK